MPKKTKLARTRLDKYYHLAKEQGYRSRAAFKLIQLNKKYNFLGNSRCVVDLCAAPGGWLQVASKFCPVSSVLIGVDLEPIKSIRNCITLVEDITTQKCLSNIKKELKTWNVDLVLHDGAPNVGSSWTQDAYAQSELVLASLKLATQLLRPGGMFVTKVFRSPDYTSLLWVFHQFFHKVEATKPQASRNTSAEIYVICSGYKAPTKIDPKLLDSKHVFKELEASKKPTVLVPKKGKPNRSGYEDGNMSLFKKCSVMELIKTNNPISLLTTYNQLSFDDESAQLAKDPTTTYEIRSCCDDLRVLGKRDFKNLLKWRSKMRELLGLEEKPAEEKPEEKPRAPQTEEEEEELLDKELSEALSKLRAKERRKQKKIKEQKTKHAIRMANSLASENVSHEDQELFAISDKPAAATTAPEAPQTPAPHDDDAEEPATDLYDRWIQQQEEEAIALAKKPEYKEDDTLPEVDDVDDLRDATAKKYWDVVDSYLDKMYDSYQTKRKKKSKSRRKEKDAEKTTTPDVSYDPLVQNKDDEDDPVDSGAEYESDDDVPDVADLAPQEPDDPNAQVWFSRDVFGMLDDGKKKNKQTTKDNFDDDSDDMEVVDVKEEPKLQKGKQQKKTGDDKKKVKSKQEDESSDDDQTGRKKKKKSKKRKKTDEDEDTGFEEVPIQRVEAVDEPWDKDENETISDTVTSWDAADTDEEAEDLALGKKLVQKKLKLSELVDMTFNRYTWNDDGAPKWFTEEDSTHRRPLKPITKEEVNAMRERFREINSRPIKKVAEAKARKKLRAMKQLEKAKKAAESIANNQDLSNKDKMKQIEKLYAKGLRKQKQETVYVVSKKGGLSKSTKIKGKRVKVVDPRQKKDKRSEKAQAKRAKK